ncbi:MAG: hypothetical protein Kow0058_01150 [Roseovarius sp.]
MYKRLMSLALIFGAAALAPPAPPAEAQAARCLPRSALVEALQQRYGEQMTGGGLQSAQRLLEVWSSAETGTFTVFFTQADGTSCILATGQYWTTVTPATGQDNLSG